MYSAALSKDNLVFRLSKKHCLQLAKRKCFNSCNFLKSSFCSSATQESYNHNCFKNNRSLLKQNEAVKRLKNEFSSSRTNLFSNKNVENLHFNRSGTLTKLWQSTPSYSLCHILTHQKVHFSFFVNSSDNKGRSGCSADENGEQNQTRNSKRTRTCPLAACVVAAFGGVIGVIFYDNFFARKFYKREELLWDYEWDSAWNTSVANEAKTISTTNEEKQSENQENQTSKKKKFVRQILLIRHGQYILDKGDENYKSLTELGRKQAKVTALRLKEILKDKHVTRIYHSSMKRAKETAQIISAEFPELELVEDSDLSEGIPEMPIPISQTCKPSKETIEKDKCRIDRAFQKIFYRPQPNNNSSETEMFEIVVCHGNVIRYFFCKALQFPVCAWLRLSTYNCGITWLSVDSSGYVSAREFGNVGHIPHDMISYY